MVDIDAVGEFKRAFIRCQSDVVESHPFGDVDVIWLRPENGPILPRAPLHVPNLKILHIEKCRQEIGGILDARTMSNIHTLLVIDAPEPLAGLSGSGPLTNLTTLKVRRLQLTEDAVDWVTRQPSITALAITDTNFSDGMIRQLRCKSSLKRLDLFRSEVSFQEEQLAEIEFPQVRSLDVSGTKVSGHSVDVIRRIFPKIERLLAEDTQLTQHDLRKISKWDGMRVLSTGVAEYDFDTTNSQFWDL